MRKSVKKIVLSLAIGYTPLSMATLFEYSDGPGAFGNGGTFDSIYSSYDTNTGVLTWEVDNAIKNGSLMDGFWLVLNDGPSNPKGDDGLAIFYADFVDYDGAGSSDNSGLWAYEYNGQNNPSSYSQTEFLGDLSAGLIDSGTTRGFSIDVSSVYSQVATSVPFDDMIGIWFHPNWNTYSEIDGQGLLADWNRGSQSWYDRSGRPTTAVPEPGSLTLLGLGLLGLSLSRRTLSRQNKS